MRILSSSVVVVGVLCAAACGSVTTYQSADPIGRGHWQGMAAVGSGTFRDTEQDTRTPTLNAELGARYGVADATDVGLKLYSFGVEASVRQRIVDGGVGGWSWAVLGAVGGVQTNARGAIEEMVLGQLKLGGVTTRRTSAKFGWNLGGVAIGSLFVPAGGGHATGITVGGFGGLDWRFGAKWHLVPELSVHRSVSGDVPVRGSVGQLGVAFARDF